jgi:hypothetical protein
MKAPTTGRVASRRPTIADTRLPRREGEEAGREARKLGTDAGTKAVRKRI